MNDNADNGGWRVADYFGDDGRWHYNEENSDDGYDAAVDAYNEGYGPPVTRRQRQEEQDWVDELRRNGY